MNEYYIQNISCTNGINNAHASGVKANCPPIMPILLLFSILCYESFSFAQSVDDVHYSTDYRGYPGPLSFDGIPPASSVCNSESRFDDRAYSAIELWAKESSEFDASDDLWHMVDFFGWVKRWEEEDFGCWRFTSHNGSAGQPYNLQAYAKLWVAKYCPDNPHCESLLWSSTHTPDDIFTMIDINYANEDNSYYKPHIFSNALSGFMITSEKCDSIGYFRCGDYDFFTRSLIPIYFDFRDVLPNGSSKMIGQNPGLNYSCDCVCNDYSTCNATHAGTDCVDYENDLIYWGGSNYPDWFDVGGYTNPDTENHLYSVISAQYLRNQIFNYELLDPDIYDGSTKGNTAAFEWMLFMNESSVGEGKGSYTFYNITDPLKMDFHEYNALPYQGHTWESLRNLYEYAEPPTRIGIDHESTPHAFDLSKAAHIVLDYMSASFAIQSSDLRRMGPFRRRMNNPNRNSDNIWNVDALSSIYAILSGNYRGIEYDMGIGDCEEEESECIEPTEPNQWLHGRGSILFPSVGTYRVPDLLLDIMIDKDHNPYFFKSRPIGKTVDLVYSERDFMISAGGTYFDAHFASPSADANKDKDGASRNTVLMISGKGPMKEDMIRFNGYKGGADYITKRNQTCVFENFACGMDPIIPESFLDGSKGQILPVLSSPPECSTLLDNFTFISIPVDGTVASAANSVYVAVFKAICGGCDGNGDNINIGFFEANSSEEFPDPNDFVSSVLTADNCSSLESFDTTGINTYITTRGSIISFKPYEKDQQRWAIKQVISDGVELVGEDDIDFSSSDYWSGFASSNTYTRDYSGRLQRNDDFIIRADGTGQVLINNPQRSESLFLSLADPWEPIRILQDDTILDIGPGTSASGQPSGSSFSIFPNDGNTVGYVSLEWLAGSNITRLILDVDFLSPEESWSETVADRSYVIPGLSDDGWSGQNVNILSDTFRTDFDLSEPMADRQQYFNAIPYVITVTWEGSATLKSLEVYSYKAPFDTINGGDCDADGVPDENDLCNDPTLTVEYGHGDIDSDTVIDECDTCPFLYNPLQEEQASIVTPDTDHDGILDFCDPCIHKSGDIDYYYSTANVDSDGDDVWDNCDNCTTEYNPDQNNSDSPWDPFFDSPLPPGQYSSLSSGDICDPDPVANIEDPLYSHECSLGSLESIEAVWDPQYIGFEQICWGGDIALCGQINRAETTDFAYCNCTGLSKEACFNPSYQNCQIGNDRTGLDALVGGPGWHRMLAEENASTIPEPVNRWYGKGGHTDSQPFVWNMLDSQEYLNTSCTVPTGSAHPSSCGRPFKYLAYSQPFVDGGMGGWDYTTYPDRSKIYYPTRPPEFAHGGYSDPEFAAALVAQRPGVDCLLPSPWRERLDAIRHPGTFAYRFNTGFPLPDYSEWPMPLIAFAVPSDSTADVNGWEHSYIKPSSATKALLISQFDSDAIGFNRHFRSISSSPADVPDTLEFSLVRVVETAASSQDHASIGGAESLWIFGGHDSMGDRNDLWKGIIVQDESGVTDGTVHWSMIQPSNNMLPSPRHGASMFYDPSKARLVVVGGYGNNTILADTWEFDVISSIWSPVETSGDVPQVLAGLSSDQIPWPVESCTSNGCTVTYRPVGLLWGSEDIDGHSSSSLYAFDIQANDFINLSFSSNAPPAMESVSIAASTTSKRLYLFGGDDGSSVHNWMWMLDLTKMRWTKVKDDCVAGTCPYFSGKPIILISSKGNMATVFPSNGIFYRNNEYYDRYFTINRNNSWMPQRVRTDHEMYRDCNGDGAPDIDVGELCNSSLYWWDMPGQTVCDTITDSSLCEQPEHIADVFSRNISGLRDFDIIGDTLYLAISRRIATYNVADPGNPVQLSDLDLGVEIRDIDLSPGLLVVAADSGIGLIDINDPTSPELSRWINGCGRVTAVKTEGNRIHFLTRLGIGDADIGGDSEIPDNYSLLYPTSMVNWEMLAIDPGHCYELSHIAETACAWFGCPLDAKRPFDVSKNTALVPVFRKLLIIDTSASDIVSIVTLFRAIKGIRIEGDYAYVNSLLGSTETVFIADPVAPSLLGSHDVVEWVNGMSSSDDLVLRNRGTVLEVAHLQEF